MRTYFGINGSIAVGGAGLCARSLTADEARGIAAEGIYPCLRAEHRPFLEALFRRYGIVTSVPDRWPRIAIDANTRILMVDTPDINCAPNAQPPDPDTLATTEFVFTLWS